MMKRDGTRADSELQTKYTVADFFLGTQESYRMETFFETESLPSAYIVLQEAGSIEEVRKWSWRVSWGYSVRNFSVESDCCVQI